MATTNSTSNMISIQNVVMSSDTQTELEIANIASELPEASYHPNNFPGMIYRHHPLGVTVLFFRSGKITCTGSNTVEDGKTSISKAVDDMIEIGVPIEKHAPPEVQNIVLSGEMADSLNLNAIAIALGLEKVEYEPEQFPGLIYKPTEIEGVCLLFGSGKIVITGVTNEDNANTIYEHTLEELTSLGLI